MVMESAETLMYEEEGFRDKRPGKVNELCKYLFPVMNEIHETDYSERFWSILLKGYATTCVNRELLMSDHVLSARPVISPINGWELPTRKERWNARIREVAIAFYKRHPMYKVNQILKEKDNICVGIRGKVFEEFGLGTYCPAYHSISSFFLDYGLRKNLKSIAAREASIFKKNVLLQLPRYLVEDFKKNISKIELYEPQKKIFHAEHLAGIFDLIIALYVDQGAKYYKYQLGGFMGETKSSVTPEKYIGIDKLRTYGWKIHEKDEPHVAYRLEQFRNGFDYFTPDKTFDACIVYNQIDMANKNRYKTISNELFENLDFNKYPHLLLRPRGKTRKLDNSSELSFLNPPPPVDIDQGKKPMHEIVKASRIMVQLSLPSTNFLECVYVDHPIVAIFTVSDPTEIIKPYYQFFLDQNVMHNDIDSLVKHLNSVDVESWWNKVTSEPMYREFKNKFAREVE